MSELKDLFGFNDDSIKMGSSLPVGENVEGFKFVRCEKDSESEWNKIDFIFNFKGSEYTFSKFIPDASNPRPFPNETRAEAVKREFVNLNSFFFNIADVWGFADDVRDNAFSSQNADDYWDELIELFNNSTANDNVAFAKIIRNSKGYANIGYKLPVFSVEPTMFYSKSEKKYNDVLPNKDSGSSSLSEEEASLL